MALDALRVINHLGRSSTAKSEAPVSVSPLRATAAPTGSLDEDLIRILVDDQLATGVA